MAPSHTGERGDNKWYHSHWQEKNTTFVLQIDFNFEKLSITQWNVIAERTVKARISWDLFVLVQQFKWTSASLFGWSIGLKRCVYNVVWSKLNEEVTWVTMRYEVTMWRGKRIIDRNPLQNLEGFPTFYILDPYYDSLSNRSVYMFVS